MDIISPYSTTVT